MNIHTISDVTTAVSFQGLNTLRNVISIDSMNGKQNDKYLNFDSPFTRCLRPPPASSVSPHPPPPT